jgi:Zn-dependent peptidase ImmA (M78 family)
VVKEGVTEDIPINFARRLVEYYAVAPPVDVVALAQKTAKLIQALLPITADGACLKGMGKPIILVNTSPKVDRTTQRIRFTIAHEIGHAVNPMHNGSFLDESMESIPSDYMEVEANRFASELLMPIEWMRQFENCDDPSEVFTEIAAKADVSHTAAMFRLIGCLPRGWVVARCGHFNHVLYAAKSPGTVIDYPRTREEIEPAKRYPFAEKFFHSGSFYWWKFSHTAALPERSLVQDWRDLQKEMLADLKAAGFNHPNPVQSIAGMIGMLNPRSLSREDLYCSMRQNFHRKASTEDFYKMFVAHPKFEMFLVNRIEGGFGKK